jgi:hypothetical protein
MNKQFYFLAGMLAGVLLMITVQGCTVKPKYPTEYSIKIQSEIPVTVTVQKSCEGNWNFCKWQN